MTPIAEAELVMRAKQDPLAFGELYELHFDRIYRYVYNQVRIHPETQDIVSETFLKALRAIDNYTPSEKPFIAWLYSIARNCTIDHFRRSRREIIIDNLSWGDNESPLHEVEEKELIEQALKNLTKEQQQVLRLHYLEDMKFKDIAVAVNKTEGAVKALALRALNRLRLVMTEEGVSYGV